MSMLAKFEFVGGGGDTTTKTHSFINPTQQFNILDFVDQN